MSHPTFGAWAFVRFNGYPEVGHRLREELLRFRAVPGDVREENPCHLFSLRRRLCGARWLHGHIWFLILRGLALFWR